MNPVFRGLASQFLSAKIRRETAKGDLEGGKPVLNTAYKQFPFLQPDRRAEAALEIAKAFQLCNGGEKEEAMKVADSLALADKDRVESLREVFHFYDKPGIHWFRPFQLLVQMEKLDPGAVASEPALGGNVDYYLEKGVPEDGIEEFLGIILRHYRDPARKKLDSARD